MRIIVDSCVDFNDTLLPTDNTIARVPFKITIDGVEYTDNGKVVADEFRKRDYKSNSIRTACPSPGDFYEAMKGAAESFVVTISSKLSGAYQSAKSAVTVLLEEQRKEQTEESQVHVFDSKSASAGQNLIALKIQELVGENQPFTQIVEKTEEYIKSIRTLFAIDSLDTLVSNGRVSKTQQLACRALKLFPIMGEDGEGNIQRKAMVRGERNVIPKLIDSIGEGATAWKDRVLAITHVNALEKAEEIKQAIIERYPFKDVHIFEAGGLSSVYASNGGIILAY